MRSMRARVGLAIVGSIAVIAFLAVAVFPTRTLLNQRHQISAAEHRVAVLSQTNAALQKQVDELGSDSAIERIAREQHNLVKPGEDAYAVLPPAGNAAKVAAPALAPAAPAPERSFLVRLRDRLSFWD